MASSERTVNSPRLFVGEDAGVDVRHEVSSRRVGHDEAHVVRRLEASVQVHQERVSRGVDHLEDPLLTHEADGFTRTDSYSGSSCECGL